MGANHESLILCGIYRQDDRRPIVVLAISEWPTIHSELHMRSRFSPFRLSRFGFVVLIAVAFHCADYPSVAAQFSAKASNDHIDNIASAERLLPNLTQQFVACHHAAGTL